MSIFSGYKSKAPLFQELPIGEHEVRISTIKPTDSFHNYDGSLKNPLPAYANSCEQLAVTFVSVHGKGGITNRFNGEAYVRTSDLTEKELASGKYTDVKGYACAVEPKSKKLVRLVDEDRCKSCENIMDQFIAALGLPAGSTLEDLDEAQADQKVLRIVVRDEPYEGKPQMRVVGYKKIKVEAPAVTSDIDA